MAGSKPGYKEIADELRMQIERGKFQPGEKIPSQSALMAEFQAYRETVTKALRLLEDLGLTTTTQGRPHDRPRVQADSAPSCRAAVEVGLGWWHLDVGRRCPRR